MKSELSLRAVPVAWSILAFLYLPGGCIEIQGLLQSANPGTTNPPGVGAGVVGSGDPQADGGVPVVSLRVSNSVPGLNETVFLTCTRTAGSSDGLSFSFQPDDGTLTIDRAGGTASFTVSEPDIGAEFPFACTATNDFGTSAPSNRVTVIPTG